MLRGKSTREADMVLRTIGKRAGAPLRKLLASAVANAKHNTKTDPTLLIVRSVRVDKGKVLKRGIPRAQGRMTPIHKHTSHILLTLAVDAKNQGVGIKNKEKKAKKSAPKAKGTPKKSS